MFKERLDFRVISSFPLSIPSEVQRLDEGNDVSVDILEMGYVCPIRWYILQMAVNSVFCLASIGQLVDETADIYHGEGWLLEELLNCMNPDIDIAIQLFDWVFSE